MKRINLLLVNPRYGICAGQITSDPFQVHEVTNVREAASLLVIDAVSVTLVAEEVGDERIVKLVLRGERGSE